MAQGPFEVRGRQSCEAWPLDGYGSPIGIYVVYLLKIFLYVLAWACFCSFGVGPLPEVARWWLTPLAFQKAIAWSMLFAVWGSGPLTAPYHHRLNDADLARGVELQAAREQLEQHDAERVDVDALIERLTLELLGRPAIFPLSCSSCGPASRPSRCRSRAPSPRRAST